MASLTWTWKDWWQWFSLRETTKEKADAWKEFCGDGWLENLSSEEQAQVLQDAPEELLKSLKSLQPVVKYNAILLIQHELDKKYKKTKKFRKRGFDFGIGE